MKNLVSLLLILFAMPVQAQVALSGSNTPAVTYNGTNTIDNVVIGNTTPTTGKFTTMTATTQMTVPTDSSSSPGFNVGAGGSAISYGTFGGGRFMIGYDSTAFASAGAGVLNMGTTKGLEIFCNGTNGSFLTGTLCESITSGGLHTITALQAGGTKFTTSGCAISASTGGATAGKMTSGTTGTCTVVITLPATANGWHCDAGNETSGIRMNFTADSTTSCIITGTTTSGDIINFSAMGF